MPTPFEAFVNSELPKRVSSKQDPLVVQPGYLLRTTGVGLEVEFVPREDVAPDGKSAFDLAVEAGFVGTEPEWLTSLQGEDGLQGVDGAEGPIGRGITVQGTVTQEELDQIKLEGAPTIGDAYFVGEYLYVYNGDIWVESPSFIGPDGKGLNYLGTWPDASALPVSDGFRAGDTYVWQHSLWTYVEVPAPAWIDIGVPGPTGMSAYESAIALGTFVGTEVQWLQSLKGKSAYELAVAAGFVGNQTVWLTSLVGKTAYELAVAGGFVGNQAFWLASLVGKTAFQLAAESGFAGTQAQWLATLVGKTAFQLAAESGFIGTQVAWLQTLVGKTAYELAVAEGFSGTQAEWLLTLKGGQGIQGIQGEEGPQGTPAVAFEIVGSYATIAALRAAVPVGVATEAYYVGQSLYVWVDNNSDWLNIGTLNGQSAYQIAVADGFVGTITQWLLTLKGEQGIQGEDGPIGLDGPVGPAGQNLAILGTKADSAAILAVAAPAEQAAYVALDTGNLWIYIGAVWTDLGKFRGADGVDGLAGVDGVDGTNGTNGIDGLAGADGVDGLAGVDGTNGTNGIDGRHVVIKGSVPNLATLPAIGGATEQDAYTTLDTSTLYMAIGGAWISLGVFRGANGTNGVDGVNGTNGTNGVDGTNGIDGLAGADGINGVDGKNVVIKGVVANAAALPAVAGATEQDAYVLQDTLHLFMKISGMWTDLGTHQGSGIDIIAVLDTEVAVAPTPNAGNRGKAYVSFIGDLFVNIDGATWTNVGSIRGSKGDQGQGLNIIGTVVDVATLPDPATLQPGDAYFTFDTKLMYVINDSGQFSTGVDIQGPQGEEGIAGPVGATGTSISIMGSYATAGALTAAHPTGNPGEGYLVGSDLYLYGVNPVGGATGWYNVGPVRGPQGVEGPIGKTGLKGNPGVKGDRGTLWISLPPGVEAPNLAYGVDGDWAVNTEFQTYYRAVGTGWIAMGRLVAGDVNSPLAGLGKVVRLGTDWVPVPVDEVPTPVDGSQYARQLIVGNLEGETEWVEIVIPEVDVLEAPNDTKLYGRKSEQWVEVVFPAAGIADAPNDTKSYLRKGLAWIEAPAPGLSDAPNDTKLYGRKGLAWTEVVLPAAGIADVSAGIAGAQYFRNKDGAWVPLDRYDTKLSNVTMGTSTTLDVTSSQLFKIPNTSGTTTITLGVIPGVPANRAMTVVLVISGNAGTLAWGTTINWNGGTVPTLGATKTVITLLWDGSGWIGAAGASY